MYVHDMNIRIKVIEILNIVSSHALYLLKSSSTHKACRLLNTTTLLADKSRTDQFS